MNQTGPRYFEWQIVGLMAAGVFCGGNAFTWFYRGEFWQHSVNWVEVAIGLICAVLFFLCYCLVVVISRVKDLLQEQFRKGPGEAALHAERLSELKQLLTENHRLQFC